MNTDIHVNARIEAPYGAVAECPPIHRGNSVTIKQDLYGLPPGVDAIQAELLIDGTPIASQRGTNMSGYMWWFVFRDLPVLPAQTIGIRYSARLTFDGAWHVCDMSPYVGHQV